MLPAPHQALRNTLDRIYRTYNRKAYLHPDPLEFLHNYDDPADREIVGLVSASLAYGRVAQILKTVSRILERMDPSPYQYILNVTSKTRRKDFAHFTHRFATGDHLLALLSGIKQVIDEQGSLFSERHP